MPNGNKPTVDEHFVPRMYLKGFSEIKQKANKQKAYLWEFNLKSMKQIPIQVDVEDICYEKNLYELKDADGSFIAQNRIENIFGKLEGQTSRVIELIKAKSQNEQCLKCSTILSEDDKSYLIIFITAFMYRDPQTIKTGISILQSSNPDIDDRQARNNTLLNLLPTGIDAEWDENTIIKTAVKELCGMAFQIGIADDDVIITSDRPVVLYPPDKNEMYNRPKAVVFPLTSKLVLYLFPIETVDPIGRNCFIRLTEEQINDIQHNVAVYAKEWIYSRNPLTKEQLERVKEARERLPQINPSQ